MQFKSMKTIISVSHSVGEGVGGFLKGPNESCIDESVRKCLISFKICIEYLDKHVVLMHCFITKFII